MFFFRHLSQPIHYSPQESSTLQPLKNDELRNNTRRNSMAIRKLGKHFEPEHRSYTNRTRQLGKYTQDQEGAQPKKAATATSSAVRLPEQVLASSSLQTY
jgi:hypothetical protein